MASTALDRVDPIQALTQEPWINQISKNQLELIQKTVAKGLSNAETGQFLELARSLGMNPWAREIWAAKGQGRDGKEGQLLIMVGRDGLIGHAERNFDDYAGYDSGVVHENDTFERGEPDPDAKSLRARAGVRHKEGHPKDQGAIVGAWAVAERVGRPPRYFYAALSEYMPKSEGKIKYSPWGSAVAIMIEKVPISIVHRTLCGLGAVYLEEEVARAFDGEATVAEEPEDLREAVLQHLPDNLKKPAFVLLSEMNELAPNSWTASKVEMVFRGKNEKAARAELEAVEKAIEELRARAAAAPPDADVVAQPPSDQDAADENRLGETLIPDAEVVEEPASDSAAPDEAEDTEGPSVEDTAKADALKLRETDLEASYAVAEPGQELDDLGVELDQVREAIRDLGFTPSCDVGPEPGPGQDALPL